MKLNFLFQSVILEYLNSIVLGTPATEVNEIELKRHESWGCFVMVRFGENLIHCCLVTYGDIDLVQHWLR